MPKTISLGQNGFRIPQSHSFNKNSCDQFVTFRGVSDLEKVQQDYYEMLTGKGVAAYDAFSFATRLTPEQAEIAVKLLNLGFNNFYAVECAKNLSPEQVETTIKLKDLGFHENHAVECAKNLSPEQVETTIKLKDLGFHENHAVECAKNLSPEQVETTIKLKDLGFEEYYAIEGAKRLTPEQIRAVIEMGKTDIDDDATVNKANSRHKGTKTVSDGSKQRGLKGYVNRVIPLQNGAGALVEASKTMSLLAPKFDKSGNPVLDSKGKIMMSEKRDSTVVKTISIDKDGSIRRSTTVMRKGAPDRTWYNGSDKSIEMSGKEHQFVGDALDDFRTNFYKSTDLDYRIEIVTNEDENYIIYTQPSSKLIGAYEVTRYNLTKDLEDVDVLSKIKSGTMEGGEKLSTVTSENGVTTYTENYEENGLTTNRNYSQKVDENGNITSTNYSYIIKDENKNEILNLKRSWTQNPDGTTTTVINGKTYTASFDDQAHKVTIKDREGQTKTLNINIEPANDPKEVNGMWQFLKTVPSDCLEAVSRLHATMPDDIIESSFGRDNRLATSFDLDVLSHELGHSIDSKNSSFCIKLKGNGNNESGYISSNKELIEVYNEEFDKFNANHPEIDQSVIQYFSQWGGSPYCDTGLAEFVAEVNALLTASRRFKKCRQARAHYLVRYFPKTIAKIADLLGYNAATK